LNEDVMNEDVREENESSWWKNFFTGLFFITMIGIIISLIIYGIFIREEGGSKTDGFFDGISDFFSYFGDNDKKSIEKQIDSGNTTEEIVEVEKEPDMYWSESDNKILQLEQKIANIMAIVIKTFPPLQPVQPIENKEILSLPESNITIEQPDFSYESNSSEIFESQNFQATWTDVGNQLIKLEEEREKIIVKISNE